MAYKLYHISAKTGAEKAIEAYCTDLVVRGSLSAAARVLEAFVLRQGIDPYGGAAIVRGDKIRLEDAGKVHFEGVVWEVETDDNDPLMHVICYDKLKFMLKSQTAQGNFVDKTPGEVTEKLGKEAGVSVGSLPAVKKKVTVNCRGKSAYEAMMIAWTEVKKETGVPYHTMVVDGKLCVVEKGRRVAGEALQYRTEPLARSLLSVSVRESSEEACTALIVQDEQGKTVAQFYQEDLMKLYGYIQKVRENISQKDQPELNGGKIEVTAQAIGDWSVVTGYSIEVRCKLFEALLYIEEDEHHVASGVHTMRLVLSYDNVMAEVENGTAEGKDDTPTYKETVKGTPKSFGIVAYCPCAVCRGASVPPQGVTPKPWHTLAASDEVAMGTKIYLPRFKDYPGGGNFVVEDRIPGLPPKTLAVFVESHEAVLSFGKRTDTAYIDGARTLEKVAREKKRSGKKGSGKATGRFIDPLQGKGVVTQGAHYHGDAIDIGAPEGTPIVASDGGTVKYANWMSSYGQVVFLTHADGYQTIYAHMSRIACSAGEAVDQGQVIGYVGNTGHSFGAHLHFELSQNGRFIYPGPVIGR